MITRTTGAELALTFAATAAVEEAMTEIEQALPKLTSDSRAQVLDMALSSMESLIQVAIQLKKAGL